MDASRPVRSVLGVRLFLSSLKVIVKPITGYLPNTAAAIIDHTSSHRVSKGG